MENASTRSSRHSCTGKGGIWGPSGVSLTVVTVVPLGLAGEVASPLLRMLFLP